MFKSFKYKHGTKKLQKEFLNSKRITKVVNLSEAQSIGIVYNAAVLENFEIIKSFVNELKAKIPKILALGYVDQKELGENHIKPEGFSFFCQKDTNWYHKPVEQSVIDFINTPFDILIDFDLNNMLPVKFVVAASKSAFKVGHFEKTQYNYYDLTFNLDEAQKNSLSYFIEQLKIYLNMIKTK